MKPLHILLIVLTGATAGSACAQTNSADSTGLPGDNFSLEGALDLFKKSESPEEFEKNLNSEENKVNNLDLNEDGVTDYVKVIDKTENNAHAELYLIQARVYFQQNNMPKAKNAYQQALRYNKNLLKYQTILGEAAIEELRLL